ncbi:hypothetical protein [Erysipelothrix urinaevulpis]|nr:hypothetical protein [Erysipelothrix urinaevulpis]
MILENIVLTINSTVTYLKESLKEKAVKAFFFYFVEGFEIESIAVQYNG